LEGGGCKYSSDILNLGISRSVGSFKHPPLLVPVSESSTLGVCEDISRGIKIEKEKYYFVINQAQI
jgi:hypothetical protein